MYFSDFYYKFCKIIKLEKIVRTYAFVFYFLFLIFGGSISDTICDSFIFFRGLLFILETIWCQLLSIGGLGMCKICPFFKGTGIATVLMAFWLSIFYIVVLSWESLRLDSIVPWRNCDPEWNIPRCRNEYESLICDSNRTIAKYFNVQVQLQIVYLPIISICNVSLLADTWIIIAERSATSVFVGFDNFSFIGFVAIEQGKPVEEVAQSDPDLLFLAYPSGILQLPYTNVCSILFFTTFLFLGIDSQASYYKYLNSI
uniref:Uncharacterized protein n=1 Tax=Onchocerca volvulus TaxID=6282 RepID=A0A8R1TTI6_ONCVO